MVDAARMQRIKIKLEDVEHKYKLEEYAPKTDVKREIAGKKTQVPSPRISGNHPVSSGSAIVSNATSAGGNSVATAASHRGKKRKRGFHKRKAQEISADVPAAADAPGAEDWGEDELAFRKKEREWHRVEIVRCDARIAELERAVVVKKEG